MTKISRCEFYQLLPEPAPPECPSALLSDGDLPDETEEENPPE